MSLHDVSADKSAVRAVHSMEIVIIMNHILSKRIQSIAVFHCVAAINKVPLHGQSTISVQDWIAFFHLENIVTAVINSV